MEYPLLSICIPTYNRADVLKQCLTKYTSEKIFLETDLIEIIISDNCSTDNTKEICSEFTNRFPNKVKYYRNAKNILDKNFTKVLSYSKGLFSKLNNDYLYFKSGQLEKFINYLLHDKDTNMIFLLSSKKNYIKDVNGFNHLLNYITYNVTFIGGMCFKTSVYKRINDPSEYSELNFCQVGICAKILSYKQKGKVYAWSVFESIKVPNKGGYNFPKVFCANFLTLLNILKLQNLITCKVYDKTKKELLVKHINRFVFKSYKHSFSTKGYLKILIPFYWYNYYFYLDLIVRCLNKFFYHVFSIRKENGNKILVLFCFKFKI